MEMVPLSLAWPTLQRFELGCVVRGRAVRWGESLLVAWTRGNPRNYYLHYSHDNAANSCPIDETEWGHVAHWIDYAHKEVSRASRRILLRGGSGRQGRKGSPATSDCGVWGTMKIDFNAENYVICACYGLEWARSGETLYKKPPNNGRIVRTYGECPGEDRAKGEGGGQRTCK